MVAAERTRKPFHRIAPVNLSDYPNLVRIWQQCGRDTAPLRNSFVWEALRRATHVVAYRSHSQQVVGFVITAGVRLEVICVAPAYQGQGVGAELVRHATEQLGANQVQAEDLPPGLWDFFAGQGLQPAPRPRPQRVPRQPLQQVPL